MGETIKEFCDRIRRKAIVFQIGGFRPPDDLKASWFGQINLGLPGEVWPTTDGNAMLPLCQMNLTELPFRPSRLEDIDFISVFIGPNEIPSETENGIGWCIRTYKSIDELAPLPSSEVSSQIKPFPMKPTIVEEDFPCWEDVESCPEELEDDYLDRFSNVSGFKLGGWPTLIQSEIFWAPWNKHPISPEYVFQIDSSEKSKWFWGDGGVGYFGRGTNVGREDEWAMVWQCY